MPVSTPAYADELKYISVDLIKENKEALRPVDRSDAQFIELANSIAQKGVLLPILVRKLTNEETGEEYYGLVDGLQRLTSARDAGLKEIPAQIKDQDEMDVLVNQIIANAIGVETKPVQYTRQIQRLMEMDPLESVSSLAAKLNRGDEWVKNRLGLLNLTPEAADLVDQGLINVTNAYALSKLPPDAQGEFLDRAREMTVDTFIPLTVERKKELDKARREGRQADAEVFTPVVKLLKQASVEEALANTSVLSDLIAAEGAETALEGAVAALKWALGKDSKSVAAQQKAFEEKQELIKQKKLEAEKEKARRTEIVQDYKSRRSKLQLELVSAGITGAELEAQLAEFDAANAPAKKVASKEATAEAAAATAE